MSSLPSSIFFSFTSFTSFTSSFFTFTPFTFLTFVFFTFTTFIFSSPIFIFISFIFSALFSFLSFCSFSLCSFRFSSPSFFIFSLSISSFLHSSSSFILPSSLLRASEMVFRSCDIMVMRSTCARDWSGRLDSKWLTCAKRAWRAFIISMLSLMVLSR
ncbi:hypothetical protein B9Z19DRAFT_1084229 [Tuber borchii]|uniref:Uncharacterized protein n=1 Tax=Tuber borchii TaxID=42251 RepID=A0A2T6ZSD1_TUBBO|nr:hypothetical protein B9Z19DRAFT_1084229 [Tuber borchii]